VVRFSGFSLYRQESSQVKVSVGTSHPWRVDGEDCGCVDHCQILGARSTSFRRLLVDTRPVAVFAVSLW
jgi:hypothetical protein